MGFQSLGTGTGGSLCPRCGTLLTPGLRCCPRCGAAFVRADRPMRPGSEGASSPSLPAATPIPNWIEARASSILPFRGHPARPPDPGSLSPSAARGRFRAARLTDVKSGAIDPREGESFRFAGARLADLIYALDGVLTPIGYGRSSPRGDPSQGMYGASVQTLPDRQGSKLRGVILYERGIGVDRAETWRRDRWRLMGILVGSVASGPSIVALSLEWVRGGAGELLLIPALLGGVLALFGATDLVCGDYWSEVVVATYRGTTPGKVDPYHAMEAVGEYDVQIQVLRASSEDVAGMYYLPGRTIRASAPEPTAGDVYAAIRSALVPRP